MASPAGPSPGWSRRAQYGLFFGFIAIIASTVLGLVLLGMSLLAPKTFEGIRGAALDLTGPLSSAMYEVRATTEGLFSGAGDYWDAARQNGKLKRERKAMLQRMVEAKAIRQENIQLKAALGLRERDSQAVAVGRVVGSSFASPRRFAILSVGTGDGVAIGMPVRAPEGLVGRILDAGSQASRVLLASDRASVIPARLLRGGVPVIAQGRGDGTIDVRPLEVGRNPFRKNDIIVTSGTGGLYPPLIPIAKVVKLDDDGAIALPLADPSKISFAIVAPEYVPEAMAEKRSEEPEAP